MDSSISIIGGGPSGACMALVLAQRGFRVTVYEKRDDPRTIERARVESRYVSDTLIYIVNN